MIVYLSQISVNFRVTWEPKRLISKRKARRVDISMQREVEGSSQSSIRHSPLPPERQSRVSLDW